MEENTVPPKDLDLRRHYARAMLKAVPLVGPAVDEIIFETSKDHADAASRAALDAQLATIQQQIGGQSTDIGDLLKALADVKSENHLVLDGLKALMLYLQGGAAEYTSGVVERAIGKVAPGAATTTTERASADSPSPPSVPAAIDRFELSIALRSLTNEQLTAVIGNIPWAADNDLSGGTKLARINQLLTWAESVDGPSFKGEEGLAALVLYIQRQYPKFSPNPR